MSTSFVFSILSAVPYFDLFLIRLLMFSLIKTDSLLYQLFPNVLVLVFL